jgi:hypothetical protein
VNKLKKKKEKQEAQSHLQPNLNELEVFSSSIIQDRKNLTTRNILVTLYYIGKITKYLITHAAKFESPMHE